MSQPHPAELPQTPEELAIQDLTVDAEGAFGRYQDEITVLPPEMHPRDFEGTIERMLSPNGSALLTRATSNHGFVNYDYATLRRTEQGPGAAHHMWTAGGRTLQVAQEGAIVDDEPVPNGENLLDDIERIRSGIATSFPDKAVEDPTQQDGAASETGVSVIDEVDRANATAEGRDSRAEYIASLNALSSRIDSFVEDEGIVWHPNDRKHPDSNRFTTLSIPAEDGQSRIEARISFVDGEEDGRWYIVHITHGGRTRAVYWQRGVQPYSKGTDLEPRHTTAAELDLALQVTDPEQATFETPKAKPHGSRPRGAAHAIGRLLGNRNITKWR